MAGSAVMIHHGFRAGSPVVTDTGCCPSAASTAQTPTLGTTIRIARAHRPLLLELEAMTCGSSEPLVTADARAGPLRPGPSVDQAPGDFLRARDNPGYCATWVNAQKRLLTCTVG